MPRVVNTAKWGLKKKAILKALQPTMSEIVKESSDIVLKHTLKNVQGSFTAAPQSMPVPRRSTALLRSIKRRIITSVTHKVYSDNETAPHNRYVHWGTRKMRPRKFLGDVVTQYSRPIYTKMNNEFLRVMRKLGRA